MDLRTYSKEMAERCRELARKLPEGRPPRSYLLQLAASYDEAAGADAFAGDKPNLPPGGDDARPAEGEAGHGEAAPGNGQEAPGDPPP